jgi:hypothetical protein
MKTKSDAHAQRIMGNGVIILLSQEFEHPSRWDYRMLEGKMMITFSLLTKGHRTVDALQTNNNYIFSSKYQNLHISLSISSCSWYEFHMEIFKHIVE